MGKTLKKILISREPWQTRVAVVHNGKLQDLYFESHSKTEIERCFFKGKISKVLPGIQTAFVDIGQPKAGFLHITEIDRALAVEKTAESKNVDDVRDIEAIERNIKRNMDISKIFKEGEDVLIQVIKEPVGEKGPKITTCFTLPGKFVVLMPNIPQIGISKKIESREERSRLRELLQKSLPKEMGAIIRTTAEGRSAADIQKDLAFLLSSWSAITKRFKKAKSGERIHDDLPVVLRAVREHLDETVDMVVCDSDQDLNSVHKFVKHCMPEQTGKIRIYQGPPALFDYFDIPAQINEALQKKVFLKSGGSLVIESTEAMTVIDVNTGKYIGKDSLEDTILKINLEAAEEIVRQLRLRNIGGLIVIDFIDMNHSQNRLRLSRTLEKGLKEKDKFQSVALKVSEFGLVQMTRKRSGKTLVHQLTSICEHCNGCGFIPSTQTMAFDVLNALHNQLEKEKKESIATLTVGEKVFHFLVNNEFSAILELEKKFGCKIIIENNGSENDRDFKIDVKASK